MRVRPLERCRIGFKSHRYRHRVLLGSGRFRSKNCNQKKRVSALRRPSSPFLDRFRLHFSTYPYANRWNGPKDRFPGRLAPSVLDQRASLSIRRSTNRHCGVLTNVFGGQSAFVLKGSDLPSTMTTPEGRRLQSPPSSGPGLLPRCSPTKPRISEKVDSVAGISEVSRNGIRILWSRRSSRD